MTHEHLAFVWFLIICIELGLYIVLDGANLGIGMLSLWRETDTRRAMMLRALGPIWNANETWLLVAAGTTFGAFPVVYSLGLNALFVPIMFTGIGLIIRAVSFAFYEYARSKRIWDTSFGIGSVIVAIGHGLLLGGLLSGISIADHTFTGTMFDWATGLTGLVTIGVVSSYLLLGYARLMQHTGYDFAHTTFPRLFGLVIMTCMSLFGAAMLLPSHNYTFFTRWTTYPTELYLYMIVALIVVFGIVLLTDIMRAKRTNRVFTVSLGIMALALIGLAIGIYPYIIPGALTIYETASPAKTLLFMLIGIGPLLPIVLVYNWYLHRIFGGSWKEEEVGYSDSNSSRR